MKWIGQTQDRDTNLYYSNESFPNDCSNVKQVELSPANGRCSANLEWKLKSIYRDRNNLLTRLWFRVKSQISKSFYAKETEKLLKL